jgi:hypothetical protein
MLREMTARYNGTCATCGNPIHRGNRIAYDTVTRKAYHVEHQPAPTPDELSAHAEACLAGYVAAGLGE